MKNFNSLLLAVLFPISGFSQYCIPTYNNACSSDDYIDNFTLNTLSVLGSGCNGNPNNYILDLVNTTSINAGGFYLMTMQSGAAWDQGFGVWIDYNKDGDFGDPGEFVYASPGSSTMPFSTSIAVPCDAVLGATRLRVRCNYGSTLAWADTCNLLTWGETEDYNITIQPPLIPGPAISLSDTCLIYGGVFIGATKYDTLTITNIGCDTLLITSIISSIPQFVPDTNGLTLLPGASYPLVVSFTPAAAIPYSGILTLLNNDNDTTICLTGTGLLPPVIVLNPAAFNVSVACGDTLFDTLTVSNTGNSNLFYSISIVPPAASTVLYDGFESGNISTWNIEGGVYTRTVTALNPANGRYCFEQTGGSGMGWDGVSHNFPATSPSCISFKVKSPIGATVNGNCAVEVGGPDIALNGSIAEFWVNNIGMTFDLWTPTDWIQVPFFQGQWYKIEFRNVNFTSKTFDYYINGTLIQSGVQFWNMALNNVSEIHLFSWANDVSYYDEIFVGNYSPDWISVNPQLGTVVPAGSQDVQVMFNTAGLLSGQYIKRLILYSNDPDDPELTVPCTLNVTGNAIIAFSDTCITFDTIYQYSTVADTLRIYNWGCDTLVITNITSSAIHFYPDTTFLVILPGDSFPLPVTFNPQASGDISGILTLFNNAGDTTVCMEGYSIPPPDIVITPAAFNVSVACGDTLADTLNISNAGGSDLTFNITGCGGPPPLQSVLNRFNANYGSITALVPSLYLFTDGAAGNYIPDGGGDMYDWGNYLNTDLGSSLAYSDNTIIPSGAMGAGGRYFTRKNPGLFVLAADINNISWFEITGNVGADGSGMADGTILTTQLCGTAYKGFVKRIYNAGDPSVNHLIIVEERPGLGQSFSFNTDDDQHRVTGLNASTRIYYLLYASSGGGYVDDPATLSIMNEFLQQVTPDGIVSWASLSEVADTLSPGGNTDIQVTFNTSGRNAGVYNSYYVVSSNDPDNPVDTIPVTMTITGFPLMGLSDSCFFFDTIFQFGTDYDTVYISNSGCDTLNIDSVIFSNNEFTVDTIASDIPPGDSGIFVVKFSPVTISAYNEFLAIYSDAPDTSVCLKGVSLPPPTIAINPDTFSVSIPCNDTLFDTLTVSNIGAADLTFNLLPCNYDSPLDRVLAALNSNYTMVNSVIPSRYDFSEGVVGNNIGDGGNDMYDGGNYLNTNLGTLLNYSDNLIISSAAMGSGGKYFTRKYQGLFVFGADVNNISWFEITGNNGADGGGSFDGTEITVSKCGKTFRGFIKRVYNATDPSVNHLIIAEDKPGITHAYALNTDDDQHRVSGLNATTRIYYLLYASALGGYINNSQTTVIMENFLDAIRAFPGWLDAGPPLSDTLIPAASVDIPFEFISTGFPAGTYTVDVEINSNDPLNPKVTIPCIFNVLGVPAIVVSDSCVVFDTIFRFGTITDTLFYSNTGCAILTVDSLLFSNSDFSADTFIASVLPGDTGYAVLRFSPLIVGSYDDSLFLFNNDSDLIICLNGVSLPPPTITLNPDTFDVIIGCNTILTLPLDVTNTGASDLIWNAVLPGDPFDDFDPGIDAAMWSSTTGLASTNCSAFSGNNMWFGNAGTRQATTVDINTQLGGIISFYLRLPQLGASPCESADNVGENVVLEYSTNGGGSWTNISTYTYNAYPNLTFISVPIPTVAKTPATRFRWRQIGHSGTCCDHWLLDNVLINLNEFLSLSLTADTTAPSGTSTINVTFNSNGLVADTYYSFITFNSNDPVNPVDTVPVTMTVNGTANMDAVIMDTIPVLCLNLDSIMEFTTTTDSIRIYNTGCDTLFIDSVRFATSHFSLVSGPGSLLKGTNGTMVIRFSPDSVGPFNGTVSIYTNELDTVICLAGEAYPRPVISWNPDSFKITLPCSGSALDTLTIYNTGLSNLIYSTSYRVTGNSMYVDGVNDFMTTTLDLDQGAASPGATFEAWVYPLSTSAGNHQVINSDNGGFDWGILRNGGSWYIFSGAANVNTGFTVDVNKWQHIAGVYIPGTGVRFYKNGQQFTSASIGTDAADAVIELGRNSGGGELFDGRIDEARVWNIQRSQAAIQSTMNKRLFGNEPGLLAYWNYDDGTPNDGSQSGYNGTFFNGAAASQPNAPVSPSWISYLNISNDTVNPADSAKIGLTFNAGNLIIGQYTSGVVVASNDPLNPNDTVPVILTVVGASDFQFAGFTDTAAPLCLYLDSIMEFSQSTANILITNTGCDTLFIDSAFVSPYEFSIDSVTPYILPDDTGVAVVRFSPDSVAVFTGTVDIFTDDMDTVFCLEGQSYPRSIISFTPDSFIVNFPCSGYATDTFTVYNNGLSDLIYSTSYQGSGNSMLVDGVNDYMGTTLNIDQGAASPGATFEAWVYPLSTSAGNHQVINSDNGGFDWGILRNGGSWYIFSGAANVNTGFTVDVNKWQHIAGVYIPGTGVRFYKNGLQFTSASIGTDASDAVIELGRNSGGGELFDGRIDEARVWNIQRSQAAIQSTMNKRLFGNEPGLLAYWNYDDGTPNDGSQSGYNGTFVNGAAANPPNAPVSPAWFYYTNVSSGTIVPGDSAKTGVVIDAGNLIIGQYTSGIILNSNDPLNPVDTIPVVLTVAGAAEVTLSDSCLFFDTIMELTSVTDTLLIINTGCDTLTGYVISSLPYFSVDSLGNDSIGGDILPGDTAFIVVIFAPDSAGPFNGTLSLFSNAGDTVICLKGFAYPKPVVCYVPDSFYVYFPVCVDSVTMPLQICNDGGSDLNWNITTQLTYFDDFDPGISPSMWTSYSGVVNTNCTPLSGNGLWFNDPLTRQTTTIDFNTLGGGNISFYIRLPQLGFPCEAADLASENVVLEYSNNGGGSWTTIATYVYNAYPNLTFVNQPIPVGAKTSLTRFRWRQLGHSGSNFDNWILDNVTIVLTNPYIIPNPVADTTAVGDTTMVNILFADNGLSAGVYNFQFFVNSNDPVNPQVIIPVVFDIDSVIPPPPVAYDTSVCQGFPNPPLIAVGDSIRWYSDPALLALVGTGNSYVPADVLPGVYDYFATSTDSFGCESQADSAYFTISTASTDPTGVTIAPDSICPGISTTLTVTGGALGVGAEWIWYADSCGGTPIDTGASITVTPPVTTVYYVRAEGSCDTTACAWDTVNVSGVPSTAAASVSTTGNNTCPGQSVTLKPVGGSLGTGASWKWFSASCGGTFIASADSIVVSPAATTAYYVRAEGTCNTTTCATITINVTNTFSSAPTGATSSANPTCPGQTVTLTRTGGTLGTGATWQWYSASCGGTPEGSGTTLVVSPLVTTTYYVRAEGTCNTTACVTVTVNATNTSSTITAVNASPTTICNGDTSQLSVAGVLGTGASWKWYTASCGGTAAGTGASISVNPNDTTIYYVRAEGTCNTTACLDVTLNVNPVPASPSAPDTSACEGGSIPDLTASGTNPKWYSDPALTVLEYAGSPFATGQTVGGIYSYYVTDSANGCTSPSDTVTLTINSASTAPTGATTSADSTCPGASVTLTRTGGVLGVGAQWVWYSGSCGGTSEGTDTSITKTPTVTTTYFVRGEGACNTTACASVTVNVTKTTSSAAASINASTNNICPSQSVTLKPVGGSLGTGASWKWFNGGCSSGFLGSGDSIIVSPAVTTTYFVKAEGTCNTTGCVSITINVTNTLSSAPTGVTASVNPTCPSQSTTLTRTGGSLGTGASFVWYADSCSGVPIGTGNSIVVSPADTTTYYIRAEGTCNTTACASVIINVSNTLSTDPASASASPATICNGDTSTLSVNGGSLGTGASWQWFTVSCGGTTAGSGASIQVNPNDTTTYYVRAGGTCNTTACVSVVLNVNPIPSAPLAADTSGCEGGVIPDLIATGSNPKWYSDSALTVFEYAGSPFATGETVGGIYTYYVTDSANGCTGPSTTVTLTINSGSTAPTGATTSADSTCPGTSSTLTVTGGALGVGAQWVWYDGSCGGSPIGTDTSVSVSPLATTTYYVRAEGNCDTTVCASVTVNVTKSPSTAATGINASTNNICPSQSVTLKPIGGSLGTGASWKWFDGGCSSGYIGSGDSITVNPAVTTTYYVKAEGTCNTTGCTSVTINVTNTLSSDPTGATVSVDSICPAQSTNITVSGGSLGTGAVWNWYADSCNGSPAGSGSTVSVAPSATTTYYVKAEGICNTTACASVTVNVTKTLSSAAGSSSATPATICNGDTSTLSVNGGSLGTGASWKWYTVSCGGTSSGTGSSIQVNPNDTTDYYVRAEGTCNTTACVVVTVNVNPIPPAPLAADTSGCEGGAIPDLTATGSNPKWYSDSAMSVFEYAGSPFATGQTTAGYYTYYVTDSANGCTGPATPVTLTINSSSTPATGATTSADSTCPGTSSTLTKTGGALGIGAQWVWYEGGCGGTYIGNDTSVSVSPLVTTTYYVRAEGACDTTACASVTVNVTKSLSTAATGINTSTNNICPSQSVTLKPVGGSLGTGASWKWFDGGCSSGLIGSGDSVIVNPAITTTYYVLAEGTCNTTGCASVTINVTNTLSADPIGATVSVDSICPAQSTNITVSGGSLGTGAVWNWYSDSCDGAFAGTGPTISVAPLVTTDYFVKAEGTCNTTACVSVTLNVSGVVSTAASSATATPATVCNGDSSVLTLSGGSLGTGAQWQWYSLSCGGTAAGSGSSVSVAPNDTSTYYVRAEGACNTTACVSVTLNVNPIPPAPLVSDTSACEGGVIPPLTAVGSNPKWYSDPALTVLEFVGASFASGDTAAGTYTYYVTDSANGCEGTATTVSLTIGSPSVPPAGLTASADSVCPGTSIVLTRSGGTLGVGAQWVWYADSCGGAIIGTGDSVFVNPLVTTQYYHRAESVCDTTACANITINVTQIPSAAATSIIGNADSICPAEPIILSVAGGSLGTGASWQWYADSCSGVAFASGDSVTVNPLVSTTYFVRAEGSCNTTSCTSITISVTNTLSTAATSASPTVDPTCPAQSTDLSLAGGSLGTGAVWNWYTDSCNGTAVGSGTLITVAPAVTTTYFVKAEGVCNTTTCVSVTVNVTNTVSTDPATAGATPSAICFGDSSTITVNGGSLGTGAAWQWYTDSCAGTPAGNGLSVTVSPVITTSYYVRAEGVCNTTACVSVTVNVNALPAVPTASSESVCEFDSVPPLTATGTGIQWYSDSSLTILVYSGNSFATGDSAAGTYNYYVTQTDTVTGCQSQAGIGTLTINALPAAPLANDTTVLYGSPVPPLVASGTIVQWYSDSMLTTLVYSGNSFATGDTALGVYTYYATQTDSVTGCKSPAAEVTLAIIPGAPAVTSDTICFGDVGLLTASGPGIKWYSDSALTVLVDSGSSFSPSDTAVGNYTYYATQMVNGIESSPSTGTLTINPIPSPPAASADSAICFGTPTPDLIAAGGVNVQWYSDAGLSTLVFAGDTFATGITAGGVYAFYVTQTVLNCQSGPDAVTLTINQTPLPAAVDTLLCIGETVPPLTASGTNVNWYSDPALSVLVATGNIYNSGDTAAGVYNYYVTDSLNGCISAPDTATLIIGTPNTFPTGAVSDGDSICEGAPVNLIVTGGVLGVGSQWVWYTANCGGIPVALGDTVTVYPMTTTEYFVRAEGGCDSTICQSITINVTQTVSLAAASVMTSADSICPGEPATLTFSGGSLGTGASWFWYGDSCGGTALGSGDSITVSPAITLTYFLRAEGACNTTICTPVTVNVTKTTSVDASAIISSGDSLCPNTPVTLGVSGGSLGTGASWQWFADSCSGIPFASGDSAAAVPAITSTYFVRAEGICNTTGCTPITISVTQTLSTDPVAAAASIDTTCPGVPSVLSVTGGFLGSGAAWNWYTDSCNGVLAGTGDSVTVAPVVTTTYYAKAEGSCNTTACTSVTISATATPSTDPASASASQVTVCSGDSTTLTVSGGSLGTGAFWIWHADSCNGAITGIGTTINVAPNDTTVYFVRAEGNCNTTSCASITVNVNAIPPAPVTGSATVCENNTIPDLAATGINPKWYNDSALTTVVGSGNTFATGQTLPGTYVYYVTDSINGCTGTPSVATLTINPVPAPPTAPGDTLLCYGSATPDLIASSGLNTQWYSDAGLTVLVNTGDTFVTGLTNLGVYTFYVTQAVLGCESAADSVALTIFQTPPPVSSDTAVCVGDPVPDLYASGTNVDWYSDSALTTLVFSGNSFATGQSAAGSYTYYATQTLNGCVSQGTAATLVINGLPSAPVSSDVIVCVGSPVPDLVAVGSNVQWFSDSLLTALVFSGDTFATGQTPAGTYVYYATQSVNGCEGPAVIVTLTILLTPPAPVVADISVCEGMTVSSFTATGTMVQWYSDSGLTNLVYTGNTYSTGQTLPGVYTYYVTDSFPGCVSPAEDAVLTITPKPAKPVGTDEVICYGDTVPDLYASGSGLRWYKDPTLVVLIGMGNYYTTGITSVGTYNYYVVDYVAGCPQSVADTVSLTINPKPLVTLNYTTTAIALGDSVQLIAYNAVIYSWSPAVGLNATTGQSVWASPITPTWYTVTGTNTYGCSNIDSVYVNVKGTGIIVINPDGYEINLYPNPTKDKVMIEFAQSSTTDGNPTLRIFNMIGEMMMDGMLEPLPAANGSTPVNRYRKEIDFSESAEGVYSLQVVTSEMVIVRKITVVR